MLDEATMPDRSSDGRLFDKLPNEDNARKRVLGWKMLNEVIVLNKSPAKNCRQSEPMAIDARRREWCSRRQPTFTDFLEQNATPLLLQ